MCAFQDMLDQRFHQLVLTALHLSEAEAVFWIEAEEQELSDKGVVIGHIVNFRADTPPAILRRASGSNRGYMVNLGIIDCVEDYQ